MKNFTKITLSIVVLLATHGVAFPKGSGGLESGTTKGSGGVASGTTKGSRAVAPMPQPTCPTPTPCPAQTVCPTCPAQTVCPTCPAQKECPVCSCDAPVAAVQQTLAACNNDKAALQAKITKLTTQRKSLEDAVRWSMNEVNLSASKLDDAFNRADRAAEQAIRTNLINVITIMLNQLPGQIAD